MALYTERAARALLPSTDQAELAQAITDASAVYAYILAHEGIEQADLRKWGEAQGLDPSRMNRALQVLQQGGRLFELAESPPGPDWTPTSADLPQQQRAQLEDGKAKPRRRSSTKGKPK